jgi:hypothetical protein
MIHGTNLKDVIEDFNKLYCIENNTKKTVYNKEEVFYPSNPMVEYFSPDLYTYKYNSHGFRSIEFSSDIDVLTVGCSFTFGTGLPFEYTWSQQLQKMLPSKKIATIAWPGLSIQKLISYIFKYFKKIGNPKMIICNFPDFYRFLFLYKPLNIIAGHYANIFENPFVTKKEIKEIKYDCPSPQWGFYINYEYILMLEQYCESNNIKLIWSTWAPENYKGEYEIDSTYLFEDIDFQSNLKNTFKYYNFDYESKYFYETFSYIYFDENGKIKDLQNQKLLSKDASYLLECHKKERELTEDFFYVAYDRYIVPEKDRGMYENHINITKSEKNKNLIKKPSQLGHFGAHRNIHWAEFYYNIIKEKYPDFI